jgi:hypothetical protein
MFYSKEFPDRPDIAFLKNHFYREGRISEEQAIFILQKGTELLKKEPNLLEVDAPITGMVKANERASGVQKSNQQKQAEKQHTTEPNQRQENSVWPSL